jgi:hypothetical protein
MGTEKNGDAFRETPGYEKDCKGMHGWIIFKSFKVEKIMILN